MGLIATTGAPRLRMFDIAAELSSLFSQGRMSVVVSECELQVTAHKRVTAPLS